MRRSRTWTFGIDDDDDDDIDDDDGNGSSNNRRSRIMAAAKERRVKTESAGRSWRAARVVGWGEMRRVRGGRQKK